MNELNAFLPQKKKEAERGCEYCGGTGETQEDAKCPNCYGTGHITKTDFDIQDLTDCRRGISFSLRKICIVCMLHEESESLT